MGYATLNFTSYTQGSLSYSFIDGRTGNVPFNRIDPNVTCKETHGKGNGNTPGKFLLSGAWSTPGASSQGIIFGVNPVLNNTFGGWFTYVPNGQSATGAATQRWYTLQLPNANLGTTPLTDIGIYAVTGGVFNTSASISTAKVGSASIALNNCNSLVLTYSFTSGTNAGQTGSVTLNRAVKVPEGCSL